MKNNAALPWLLSMVKKRVPAILFMVICDVGRGLLGVAFALGTRQVIDTAVSGQWPAFTTACFVQGGIILGILLSLALFRFLKERIGAALDRDWKKQLLHSLLHGDYSAVSAYHSGELINRMTNDVRIVNDGILNCLPNFVTMVAKLVAVVWVLVGMEPVFALAIFCVGILVMIVTGFMRRSLKSLNKQVGAADGQVAGILQETMENLLVVQAMDVGDEMEARTDDLMKKRFRIQMRRKNVSLFANTSVSVMSYGSGFAALLFGAVGILNATMTYGELTALTQLVSQLQSPIVNMSGVYPQYVAMLASAERLKELYELHEPEKANALEPDIVYGSMSAFVARDLSFTYDRNQILCDASFTLPKGAFAVICGSSGIGKSTLLKLMLGIYKPDSGGIYLTGNCGPIKLDRSTRRLFAYVPQGNLLLSGTIRDNLLLSKPDATQEELDLAIYISAMDEYLSELPKGLDTPLRENAGGLSEGQAQRLAIARAILRGAPVLLLDEATSALDAQTEMTVLHRIKALPGRTCIVVTHRPAAMELCDWRLEIEDQKIKTVSQN